VPDHGIDSGVRAVRDLVFDVGLHRGEDTAFYLKKGYRVVAFEANRELVDLVSQRFEPEIELGRLTVVWGAITVNAEETVTFYRHPTKSVWGTTESQWVERNTARGESVATVVPGVNFAEVLSAYGMPWYMKIDIEGADRHCLETLLRFESRPAFVSIESEKREWTALREEFELLSRLGYDRFAVQQQEGLHRAKQPHETADLSGRTIEHRFEEHSSGPFGDDLDSWVPEEEAIAQYEKVFRAYRMLGDQSFLQKSRLGFVALKAASRVLGTPLPGWYDTHATTRAMLEEG
jgi:FkbM family methyltransferase